MENRCHIYDINGPRPGHGHKYIKYKMCLSKCKKKIKGFGGVKYRNCQEKTASSVVLIIAVKLKFTKFSRFSTCKNLYL